MSTGRAIYKREFCLHVKFIHCGIYGPKTPFKKGFVFLLLLRFLSFCFERFLLSKGPVPLLSFIIKPATQQDLRKHWLLGGWMERSQRLSSS